VAGDKIVRSGSGILLNIPRGATFETIEKLYVDELTRYFGFPPKIIDVETIFADVTRRNFVWKDIELYISYYKRPFANDPISRLIWKKSGEINIFLNYRINYH
jgi:hypothetical protein